jgi:hypothetical protein
MSDEIDKWYLSGNLFISDEKVVEETHPNGWLVGKYIKLAASQMLGLKNSYGILHTWDTDNFFIGLKDEGGNRKDAVIAFGDDPQDSLRFMYVGYANPFPEPKELLKITSDGKVGIGTMNPSYPLDVNGTVRANRYYGLNNLNLNDYQTVNPASNVYLYSSANDRDSWVFLDSADTNSNWGIYHRQLDSPVKQLPANSIGFIGGGNSDLKAYICLADGSAYFKGSMSIGGKHAIRGDDGWLRLNQDGAFPNGVHTPGMMCPNSLNVGGRGGWSTNPGNGNGWFAGHIVADGDLAIGGKHAIRGNDGWLRLNQDGAFPNGVHTPGMMCPNSLNVGGRGGWSTNPGNGNGWFAGSITYEGHLNKLDVAEGDAFARIRAHDLWFGHSSRRGEMGRALVDDVREIVVFPQPPKSMKTLHINYGADWQAVYISGTVQTPSSRQLKENIRFLSSEAAERIISVLEPVSFTYKQDILKLECLGFIAEDTPPEVASPTHDAIAINHIVAALTRVVKDQEQSISELKTQVSLLIKQNT